MQGVRGPPVHLTAATVAGACRVSVPRTVLTLDAHAFSGIVYPSEPSPVPSGHCRWHMQGFTYCLQAPPDSKGRGGVAAALRHQWHAFVWGFVAGFRSDVRDAP